MTKERAKSYLWYIEYMFKHRMITNIQTIEDLELLKNECIKLLDKNIP